MQNNDTSRKQIEKAMEWMARSGVGSDSGGNRVMLFITQDSPVV